MIELPLLSIAIATRNRTRTLLPALAALRLHYGRPEVEVVVHDNSDIPLRADELEEHSSGLHMVYRHAAVRMSQSENYEAACSMASGKYLTMLGDDDGVAPGALDLIRYMELHGVKAAYTGFSVYYWPGVGQHLGGIGAAGVGALIVPMGNDTLEVKDTRRAVEKCMATGGTSLDGLPRLYYGIVHRELVEAVREKAGALFPGPSPDMASSMCLGLVTERMIVGNWPFFIAGNSASSAAGMGLRGVHTGEIEGHPWLPASTSSEWEARIPKYWSGPTIWAASAWAAANRMGAAAWLTTHFAFSNLYAQCLGFHPQFASRTVGALLSHLKKEGVLWVAGLAAVTLVRTGVTLTARVVGLVRRRLGRTSLGNEAVTVVDGVDTIEDATRLVASVLSKGDPSGSGTRL